MLIVELRLVGTGFTAVCRLQWLGVRRAGLMRCGAQLGPISVGPGSQSTCTKVYRIGRGAQLGAIGPIGLRQALGVRLPPLAYSTNI